jgi:type I restriction enzyme S subunit
MHDLLTRGILPNGQLRPLRREAPELYQNTKIGWIPKGWEVSDCARSFAVDSGITLGPHRRPDKRPHAYLRVANVHRGELRLADVARLEAMPGESDQVLKKYDLLIVEGHANRTEIGRCAMVTEDAEGMLFQNHLFRLRPNNMTPHYALIWMNSHYAKSYWEMACSTSSGLNTINRKMLGKMPVLVPAESEQCDIVKKAIGLNKRLQTEISKMNKLKHQKLGLMKDLLMGRVPVQVDNPEPAHA